MSKSSNKHFDSLKNKLPDNWTNAKATDYYNRAFWERCKCEYGPQNPSKDGADKWFATANEPSKWTTGCNKNSDVYDRPFNYYYSYNPDDCVDCCKRKRGRCRKHKKYRVCRPRHPCGGCHRCDRDTKSSNSAGSYKTLISNDTNCK